LNALPPEESFVLNFAAEGIREAAIVDTFQAIRVTRMDVMNNDAVGQSLYYAPQDHQRDEAFGLRLGWWSYDASQDFLAEGGEDQFHA
jgi:hypothetical protein